MVTYRTTTVGYGGWFKTQFRAMQPKPYVSPLPYTTYGATLNGFPGQASTEGEFSCASLSTIQGYSADGSAAAKLAQAKAYDKIVGKLKGEASAMLAVNIAERKQAFHMIADRATQLLTGARQLRRGNLTGMLKTFGFKLNRQKRGKAWVRQGKSRTYSISQSQVSKDEFALRRKVKSAGSLWLEYWFGWKPLVSDVYAATNVLQDVNLDLFNVFTASGNGSYSLVKNEPWYYQSKWWVSNLNLQASFGCRYRVKANVSSPNSLKANQLGLTNPATVAWELIPFSFLVDWFLPVSRFLESYTDLVGFTIKEVQLTTKRTATRSFVETSPWGFTNQNETAFQHRRQILGSLPTPGMLDRAGNGIASLSRAATAIALLSGYFKTSKWS